MFLEKLKLFNRTNILSILIIFLGIFCISIYEIKEQKISGVQYQSYRYSVLSADIFKKTGVYLAVPSSKAQNQYERFENITSDDAGYTILLSWLYYLNLVKIEKKVIEQLHPKQTGLEESRKIMREELAKKTAFIGPFFYIVTVVILILLIMYNQKSADRFAIVLLLFFLLYLPFFSPQLFIERLHSHSLIPTCVILTFISAILIKIADNDLKKMHAIICLVFSGLVLGVIDIVRHSQGIAAIGALAIIALLLTGNWKLKVARLLFLVIGLFMVNIFADIMRTERDIDLNIKTHIVGVKKHPYVHTILTGISQYPSNSLGIRSESDVVSLVCNKTGKPLKQDSTEYLETARKILFTYLTSHPIEFMKIIQYKLKSFPKRIGVLLRADFWFVLTIFLLSISGVGIAFFKYKKIRKYDNIWFSGWAALILVVLEMYIPITVNSHFSYGIATAFYALIALQTAYWLNIIVQFYMKQVLGSFIL